MKKIIDVRTIVEEKQIETTILECDICHELSYNNLDWSEDDYDINITTIKHRYGEDFPSGGHGKQIEFDICPKCFTDIILPFLHKQIQHDIIYKEWDW